MKTINIGIVIKQYVRMSHNATLNPVDMRSLLDYCNERRNKVGSPLTYYRANDHETIVYRLKVDEKIHSDLTNGAKKYGITLVDYTAFLIASLYEQFYKELINE